MQKLKLRNTYTPLNASQVQCNCDLQLNKDQSLSVVDSKVCKCGCGQYIKIKPFHKYYGIPDYINGHSSKGRKLSIEAKEKIRKSKTGVSRSQETIRKQRETLKESYKSGKIKPVVHSKDTKEEISKKLKGVYIGEKNSMYGKKHSFLSRKKISDKLIKDGNGMYGKKHPEKIKEKMRLSRIVYIQRTKTNGSPISPTIGKNEKIILDNIENSQDITIIRQFFIKGYWCDGYCKENNTVYEVDEKHHFDINGNLLEKDILRENNIKKYLNCNFVRIKDV